MKNIKPLIPIRVGGPAEKAYIKAMKEGLKIKSSSNELVKKNQSGNIKNSKAFENKQKAVEYAAKIMLKLQNSYSGKIPDNYSFPPKQ